MLVSHPRGILYWRVKILGQGGVAAQDMATFRFKNGLRVIVAGFVLAALGGCAETQFLVHTAKRTGIGMPGKTEGGGHYKVGNPYQIAGVWYYPAVDYDYDETGIASWYGPQFHAKKTANGEIFDMNEVSAAHKTLPLPTMVQVTNLENGRSLKVRINDRGPYAHGRVIDMSRRAAQLLGFEARGTAKVRVTVLSDESRAIAVRLQGDAMLASTGSPITVDKAPKPAVVTESLEAPVGGGPAPASVSAPAVKAQTLPEPPRQVAEASPTNDVRQDKASEKTTIYVQAGAFSHFDNANRVKAMLHGIGPVDISTVLVGGRDLFRVRVGPVAGVGEADRILEGVIKAGYPNARIIVD